MRAIVDLVTNRIIKVASTPAIPDTAGTMINGNYIFPVPEGAAVTIEEGDYILPQDTNSIPYRSAQELLVRYPMYDFIHYNFLLDTADIAGIDVAPTAPTPPLATTQEVRCQIGRAAGPAPVGNAPTSVRLMKRNATISGGDPFKDGLLVTDTIDISAITSGAAGTDEAMLWWKIGVCDASIDSARGYGAYSASQGNDPSLRAFQEPGNGPDSIRAWLSNDDGVTWYPAPYLEPIDLVDLGANLRICFTNTSVSIDYVLLGFCVLFVDTWTSS